MQTALFTKVLAERSLEETLEVAADVGYDAVELMGREPHLGVETTDERAAELRERAAERGVDIAAVATYTGEYAAKDDEACEAELVDLKRFCELAAVLDVDYVRQFVGGPSPWEATERHYERTAERLERAADVAAAHDVELGVEIHSNSIVEGAGDAVHLLDRVDRENVSAIHDAGNMFICDERYGPASVAELGDRLGHVHVKDIRRELPTADADGTFEMETRRGAETFSFARMGEGDVDHWRLLRALAESGYDGYVTDECYAPVDAHGGDAAVAAHELAELERLIETAERAARTDRRA